MSESDGMQLADFRIGAEFIMSGKIYRCTDIGTRTVIAIRIDQVEKCATHENGTLTCEYLTEAEAEAAGWFNGPPYAVVEHVFDGDDFAVCEPRMSR